MKLSRLSLLAVVLVTSISISAQPGGGGGMGGGMSGGMGGERGQGMMMQGGNVDLVASMGLFEIKEKDVIKKNKIKGDELVASVNRLVGDYIISIGDLRSKYPDDIDMLDEMSDKLNEGQGQSNMRTVMQELQQSSRQIREEAIAIHKSLDDGMKALLADTKFLSRWTIYYAGVCEDNNFSTRVREQGERQRGQGMEMGERGQGMSGGMGMGGGM